MKKLSLFLCCWVAGSIATRLDAGSITLTFTKPALAPGRTGTTQLYVGTTQRIFDADAKKFKYVVTNLALITKTPPAAYTGGFSALQARDAIYGNLDPAALAANNLAASNPDTAIQFKAVKAPLAAGTAIAAQLTNGGQNGFVTVGKDDSSAALMQWTGLFDSTDANNNPTQFTFRVVTDLGSLGGTYSASMFSDLQDSTIASTLFNLLAPSAASIGAELFMDGTTGIDVNFDPGVTTNTAELDFGTTSQDGTILAGMNFVPEPGSLVMLGTAVICGAGYWLACRMRPAGKKSFGGEGSTREIIREGSTGHAQEASTGRRRRRDMEGVKTSKGSTGQKGSTGEGVDGTCIACPQHVVFK